MNRSNRFSMARTIPARRILILWSLIVALVVMTATPPNVYAQPRAILQNNTPEAPVILEVLPASGEELSPDDPLSLSFDQAMDRASVESAITLAPARGLLISWIDDRNLNLLTVGGWSRQTDFVLTVSTAAKSSLGVALESPFSTKIRTIGALKVGEVSPARDAKAVKLYSARIAISFNRPIFALTDTETTEAQPNPLTLTPAADGTGRWVNSSLFVFEPTTLAPRTTYTVTVNKALTSADGALLESDYHWSFITDSPKISNVFPPFGPDPVIVPTQKFDMNFDAPVDRALFTKDFTFKQDNGTAIPVYIDWAKDNRSVRFVPYFPLPMESKFTIQVNRALFGYENDPNAGIYRYSTPPRPRVLNVTYQDYSKTLFVSFSRSMIFESLLTKFDVTPSIGNFYPTNDNANTPFFATQPVQRILLKNSKWQPGVTYTITVYPGGLDAYGNPITEKFVTTVSIPFPPPTPTPQPKPNHDMGEALPILNGDLMLTGSYLDKHVVPLQIFGKPTVKFQLFRVSGADLSTDFMTNGLYDGTINNYFNGDGSYGGLPLNSLHFPAWVNARNLIREWSATYDSEDARTARVQAELSADEAGGKLSPGLYWVVLKVPSYGTYADSNRNYDGYRETAYQYALAVSTANITIKRGARETLIWVTDLQSAKPVPNANVTVYNKGAAIATGKTDAKGVYTAPVNMPGAGAGRDPETGDRLPGEPLKEQISIIVTGADPAKNEVYSAWFNRYHADASGSLTYLHSDRPLYRPGETVYFRGYTRSRQDVTYSVPTAPGKRTIKIIAVQRSQQNEYDIERLDLEHTLFHTEVFLNEFGSFSGQFTLPAAVGEDEEVYIYAGETRITLLVREFRTPEFEVKAFPLSTSIIQGDPVNVEVRASYYFGGGVGDATIDWRMTATNAYFNYTGTDWYNFYDEAWTAQSMGDYDDWRGAEMDSAQVKSDSTGGLIIKSDKTRRTDHQEAPISLAPIQLKVEASVRDESGQTIVSRTSVMAHPATVYVGLRTNTYYGVVGKPITLETITVSPESVPLGGRRVALELVGRRWQRKTNLETDTETFGWELVPITQPFTTTLTTDASGKASYAFMPTVEGQYRARVVSLDDQGRASSSTYEFYALGKSFDLPDWTRGNGSDSDNENGDSRAFYDYSYYGHGEFQPSGSLKADQKSYKPGETAKILIPAPFRTAAVMLVTLERADVIFYDVIATDSAPALYSLPITDTAAPGATFTAMAVSPITDQNQVPDWRYGTVHLTVEPTHKTLTVKVIPGTAKARPGQKVPIQVSVTDRDGHPVNHAEVGVSVVDKAVLALVAPNSRPQLDYFYIHAGLAYNQIRTEMAIYSLQERVTRAFRRGYPGMGGAYGPQSEPSATLQTRKDYKVTPLWAPHVVTDQDGRATVTVTMPDNLTTWTIDARALTPDTQVGEGSGEFMTTLPLIVRPATPRFMVDGDRIELAMVINNNTDSEQTMTARLDAKGITLESDPGQVVKVPRGGRTRVAWWVRVNLDAPGADLTFSAVGDGVQDAAKPMLATGPGGTIPIYRYLTTDTTATAGTLRETGSRTEIVAIPPRLNTGLGDLTVRVDYSLAAATTASLDFLRNFPHQCNEQTVSRFLPNLYTLRALTKLKLSNPTLEQNLRTEVEAGLTMLKSGRNDQLLWGYWPGSERQTNLMVTAYVTYGLLEAKRAGFAVDADMLRIALEYLESTSKISQTVAVDQYGVNIFTLYVLSEAGRGTEAPLDYYALRRPNLTYAARAQLLMAYLTRFPNNPNVSTLLADLESGARLTATGTYWQESWIDWYAWGSSVRSTATVLTALLRAKPTSEALPNIVRWLMSAREFDHWPTTQETTWSLIALTDWMVATGELTPDYRYTLSLNRKPINQAAITPANVREASTVQILIKDLLADRANRISFNRTGESGALYYTMRLNMRVPVDQVKPMQRGITVERAYFSTADKGNKTPISEAAIGDLITIRLTVRVADLTHYVALEDPLPAGLESVDTRLSVNGGSEGTYFSYSPFNRDFFGDSQTNAYADVLRPGTYVYTYQARATTRGQFQAMPARAFAFYAADVFGRSAGTKFTVK